MSTTAAPSTVTFDPYRSTASREVYYVPSNSVSYPREVRYHVAEHRYTCSCPARVICRHIKAVLWHRWWRAFWPTCDDAVLADAQHTYGLQADEGTLTDEGEIAMEELFRELANREEATA